MYRRKRIDPRVIGSFVVGAIILSVAGLLFFGPGGFFSETRNYIVHFDSSVKGLNVGSPVRFRGVKIGQVKDINVRVSPSSYSFHIPVTIEIQPSRIKADGSGDGLFDALKTTVKGDDPIRTLVDNGLRAQLQMDSLVTGQLFINFDMFPETPITLTGYPGEYPELPTVSSSLEELTKAFEDLPLGELTDRVIRTMEGIEKLVTSPSLHNALAKFDRTTSELNHLLEQLNSDIPPITAELKSTIERAESTIGHVDAKIDPLAGEIEATMVATRQLVSHLDSQISPLAEQFNTSMISFDTASQRTAEAMTQVRNLTDDDSRLFAQLGETLRELNRAARSVRYLADELERDPQMLLRGRLTDGDDQ